MKDDAPLDAKEIHEALTVAGIDLSIDEVSRWSHETRAEAVEWVVCVLFGEYAEPPAFLTDRINQPST
jgi:hypothetical protein